MFRTNIDLLRDFHTSVVSQTAPGNSLIFKVTEDMPGISTLGFTTLILNVMTKNASISDPFLLTAPNDQEDEDSTVDNSVDDTVNNGSDLTHNCHVDMREGGNGEEVLHYEDFNQDVIVRSFLLGLRENFNTTTEAICFVSEKVNEIICLETKIRVSMIKESLRRNHDNFLVDYETELIMDYVSPFAESFEKFTGKKSLDEFIQKQKFYVTPTQINIWL